jgi:hypothetical protein
LIRLAAQQGEGVLGFVDETWWSRLAHPPVYSWTEGAALRLMKLQRTEGEGDPQALCCDGLLRTDTKQIWLRFVDGRGLSATSPSPSLSGG